MWKVYNIESGRIVKAGFESEEAAKEWIELRTELAEDEFDVEEMDEDEEEEFLESRVEEEEEVEESIIDRMYGEVFEGGEEVAAVVALEDATDSFEVDVEGTDTDDEADEEEDEDEDY